MTLGRPVVLRPAARTATMIEKRMIREKFGTEYEADDNIYTMGIDRRFAGEIARRFRGRMVLETCTGGGFMTIALAREAGHVYTVEIDPRHQAMAKANVAIAGLDHRVSFILGDVLGEGTIDRSVRCDAAFLDPDWAVTGEDHVFRFRSSNTRPPADILLDAALELTPNLALVLPPAIALPELDGLPDHELQKLFIGDSHELYCLWFGDLKGSGAVTELRI